MKELVMVVIFLGGLVFFRAQTISPAQQGQLKKLEEIRKDEAKLEEKLAFLERLNNWKSFQLQWVQRCTCLRQPDVIYNTLDCDKEAQQIERDKVAIQKDAERIFRKR